MDPIAVWMASAGAALWWFTRSTVIWVNPEFIRVRHSQFIIPIKRQVPISDIIMVETEAHDIPENAMHSQTLSHHSAYS